MYLCILYHTNVDGRGEGVDPGEMRKQGGIMEHPGATATHVGVLFPGIFPELLEVKHIPADVTSGLCVNFCLLIGALQICMCMSIRQEMKFYLNNML